jgi:hypothetical protein
MFRRTSLEILLVQLIGYLIIYLWNDHIGYLLSIIIGSVVFVILMVSYIVEKVEPSKVPSSYFRVMWMLWLAPVLALLFFSLLYRW